jgi:hypothetical protein
MYIVRPPAATPARDGDIRHGIDLRPAVEDVEHFGPAGPPDERQELLVFRAPVEPQPHERLRTPAENERERWRERWRERDGETSISKANKGWMEPLATQGLIISSLYTQATSVWASTLSPSAFLADHWLALVIIGFNMLHT